VIAPNPSPMTLDGTNTYVVGLAGSGATIIVDPGPDAPAHRTAVLERIAALDADVSAIVVTHRHEDHAAAAAPWARALGCMLVASDEKLLRSADLANTRAVADDDRLQVGGMRVEVVATPGHTDDHLALRLPTGALLVGDHVLGRGTSVIAWPEGDLTDYLDSLRRVRGLGAARLLPGHGPVLDRDPAAVVDYYLAHREHRLRQLLEVLDAGPADVSTLVAAVHPRLDPRLQAAAFASTRAAVAHLLRDGRVEPAGDDALRRAGSAGFRRP
jgi:glyoxylase-like metal-dependent hydrolase (beta-lactamase superfamily II)